MSYLEKLQIQGIRSFDSNHSQVVQFYPLTIILGPNGAGKTSIIEALKYATTGQTPPNSGSGKTFVLDPIIANSTTVRAQVRLKFVDIQTKTTTITRSVELNAKKVKGKTSLSFKSLNSVIKRDDIPIDQRCADINNEMLELLGVSKAVLTHVIFCHQEECNWPLSEGKVLKERFDDIFGSMGYVKALERIKKLRQSELSKQKLLDKDVLHSKYVKDESDRKKKELKKYQTDLDTLKQYYSESETKLASLRSEYNQIVSKEETIQTISNKINQIKGSLSEKQRNLERLKKNITTQFTGTEDELKSEIENFETNGQSSVEKKESLKNKESVLAQNYSKLNQMQQNLNKEITKLQFAEENHKKLLNDRNQLVSKMANETNISIDGNILDKINSQQMLDSSDMFVVLKLLSDELIKLSTDLSDRKTVGQEKSELLMKQLNEFKANQSKYEHEVQLWQTEQKAKLKSVNDLKTKLKGLGESDAQYETLNENIKRLSEEVKQLESVDIESKKKDNQQKESEKRGLKSEINLLEEKLNELQQQNEERIKLEILKKDKTEREAKVTQISELHSEVMQTVGAIDGQFHSSLSTHIQTISSQIDRKSTEMSKKENELTSEETKVEIKNESLKKKRREVKDMELKLKKVCKLEEYEQTLSAADSELKELRLQLSNMSNYEPFLKSQIHSIEDSNSCPVCERDVNSEWSAKSGHKLNKEELVGKLSKLVEQTPDTIQELKNKIKLKEKELNDLIGLRSVVEAIKSLNAEIPKIETEMNSSEEENAKQKTFIQNEKMKINKQKTELNAFRDVLQDATDYDKCWTDIQQLNRKINSFDLNSDLESESIEDVNNDLQQKRAKYEELDSEINKNQKFIVDHSENVNKTQNSLQNNERKKLEIERQEHEMTNYKKKIEELNAEIDAFDTNITNSQLKAMEMNPKVQEMESQIKDANKESKELEQKIQTNINLIKEKQKDIEKLNKDIESYQNSGKNDEMSELTAKLSELKEQVSEVETERQSLTEELSKLSEEISSHELRKRELKDSLQVMELEKQINENDCQLKAEEEKLGFSNVQELRAKKRDLEKQIKISESLRSQSEGKQMPVIESITKLEKDLKAEPFRSADNNYRQKCVDLAISEISGEDLNKYYKALDFAVSDFHRKKIEEINKLIKGFWRQAYRGLDIDYIKIVSDEVERSANDRRRTFNYRVVMVKSDTEMDMRGRCSAGQKVLASLVIRLALAEIFCTNCSVLALDEPTTNLDKENIISFANAITEIVKYRKKWKNSNFQLIIITHDEEFLNCLDSETGQFYYKVFKKDGFSTILRKSINEREDDKPEDQNDH